MQQIITLHIGQAGVQIGSSLWDLFCHEHSLNPKGNIIQDNNQDLYTNSIFQEVKQNQFTPRAFFLDLEPTVIDQVKTGNYKQLFNQQNFVNGKEDAANNFSRGIYTTGKQYIDLALDRIKKMIQKCSSFQGFMIFHSVGGGTGSGLGSLLMEKLSYDYGKKAKFNFIVYPSKSFLTSVVEPYNTVLSTHYLLEHSDATILYQNEAIYEILSSHLEIQCPLYQNVNKIIAQTACSLVTSFRADGIHRSDMNTFLTNLIPYPRIHFLSASYSSLISLSNSYQYNPSVNQITNEAFQFQYSMLKNNPRHGRYMSCSLMYRGDCILKDILSATNNIKNESTIKFCDWVPTGIKISVNNKNNVKLPNSDMAKTLRSLCMMSNNTSIAQIFSNIDHKFDILYAQRGFVHWYVGEGMQQGEFSEAREDLAALQKDFEDGYCEYWQGEQEEIE